MNKVTDFPQYRKLSNNKVYYRIDSNDVFVEIQIVGNRAFLYEIKAEQYPEKLRIQEMLSVAIPGVVSSNLSEFEEVLKRYLLEA
jgi:hypothetical protein